MSIAERAYALTPEPFQDLAVSAAGYLNNRSRYGRAYWHHRSWLRDFDTWSLDHKLDHQARTASAFVEDARRGSAFYAEVLPPPGSALADIPILEKETLRSRMSDIRTIPRRGAVENHTGGTSGASLAVLATREDQMVRMAQLDHFKARHGFQHLEMRRATFNGKHIVPRSSRSDRFWRYNAACRQMMFSSFDVAGPNLAAYVSALNDFRPHAIDGFFSAMCDVAAAVQQGALPLKFRPVAIFPTSEVATPEGVALLEEVFQAPVYDQYASSEGAPFLTQCGAKKYHVEMSSGIFEHPWSDSDEFVVTSFTTHGTPLIRYRIGDSAVPGAPAICECGLASQMMGPISGRTKDYILGPNGLRLNAGNVANIFKNIPNAIKAAQVIQNMEGAITILVVPDVRQYRPDFDRRLVQEAKAKLGDEFDVRIEHVEDIPRAPSGKAQFIRNTLTGVQP